MEKYGVEQEPPPPKTKTSGATETCRACGSVLRPPNEVGISLCPNCGSRPYEVRR